MARFRGTVQGNRSEASRLGHGSGLRTECNGWRIGVTCHAAPSEISGEDMIGVYVTDGSGQRGIMRYLGSVQLDENGDPEFTPYTGDGYAVKGS